MDIYIIIPLSIAFIFSSSVAIIALREVAQIRNSVQHYHADLTNVVKAQKLALDHHILAQSNINAKLSNRLDGITKRINNLVELNKSSKR